MGTGLKRFAVTAMGRSGTMFLSSVLNLDPDWEVQHEPVPGFRSLVEMQHRFDQAKRNYGEVNSFLRDQFLGLKVHSKAVILRDPIQIYHSMFNRGKPNLSHLNSSLIVIDALVKWGILAIAFSRMTTDESYLRSVAVELGVTGLPEKLLLEAKNASHKKDMDPELEKKARERLGWFIQKYGDRW